MKYKIFILIVFICSSSCLKQQNKADNYIYLFDDSVKLRGDVDIDILKKYINNEVDYTYLFGNYISMSVILESPAIYHCFVYEYSEEEKQVCYLKIDDGIKYNFIPNYDSLNYDLQITREDLVSGKMPSSKYYNIFEMRKQSIEYQQLTNTCDDIDDLTDYLNNSIFFQNSNINDSIKQELLLEFIKITQIFFVEYFYDIELPYYQLFEIFHGFSIPCAIKRNFQTDYNSLYQYIKEDKEWIEKAKSQIDTCSDLAYKILTKWEILAFPDFNVIKVDTIPSGKEIFFKSNINHFQNNKLFWFDINCINGEYRLKKKFLNKEFIFTSKIYTVPIIL
ncbi:MAG: hypothetical protein MJ211_15220 [Bacteroidales bacterium]|nr:hypothetical protein [Bacteroidales bacterium]